jgi:hypothetical protein
MPKVRIKTIRQKHDLSIRVTRYLLSIKAECTYNRCEYIVNNTFVYGRNSEIVGWNVRNIDEFWRPYISRIYANAIKLDVGQSITIFVEYRYYNVLLLLILFQ